jgi:hypothetical protein
MEDGNNEVKTGPYTTYDRPTKPGSDTKQCISMTHEMPRKIDLPSHVKGINSESVIILSSSKATLNLNKEELIKKYSEKFGCKVVILKPGISYIGKIDG